MTPDERASNLAGNLMLRSGLDLPQTEIVRQISEEISAALRELLQLTASTGRCRGCQAPIFWIRHLGKPDPVPYSQAGINHFIDCPARDQFRSRPELMEKSTEKSNERRR